MLFSWQATNDNRYQAPFTKSLEEAYAGSDIKRYEGDAIDKVRQDAPVVAAIAPPLYAIGIRKQVSITSSKLSLVPDTVTTYNYDQRAKSGSINVVWRF